MINIRKFIKQADDMGMNAGDIHWGNRGVVWHRFNIGSYSKMPQSMSNVISEQMRMFENNYERFAINNKTGKKYSDFRGMLFTIYAEDRSITPDIENKIPEDLKAAAEKVKRYEIKLPVSREKPEKYIGGNQWISHYAYAWKDQYPNDVSFDDSKSSPRSILQLTSKTQERYEHGPLIISPTSKGFGLFIHTNENRTIPIYIGQSAAGLTKYFEGNISPNQSNVYMPDGIKGKVIPARVSKDVTRRSVEENEMLRDQDNIHRFVIEEDGSIGIDVGGRFVPFSQQQISSIVPRLNTLWYIRPAKEVEGTTIDMGPWRMSEELKNLLSQENVSDGFVALKKLRNWLDTVKTDLHTPAEGFKIITIGPIFSSSNPIGEGETIGNSQFVTELTRSNHDKLAPGSYQRVRRDVQWVVLANEISEARYEAAGKTIRPSNRAQGESERSPVYDSPQEAIAYVKNKYLSNSQNSDKILNEMADSVMRADGALKAASGVEDVSFNQNVNQGVVVKQKPEINNINQQNISQTNTENSQVNNNQTTNNQEIKKNKPRITLDPRSYKSSSTSDVKKWILSNVHK